MFRAALIALTLLALPASAHAAEGFVGVLENGQVVTFTSQEPYGLSRPVRLRGLIPGERIVALANSPHGVVGVGTSARLYRIDPTRGLARPVGAPFAQGLRGARFSLAAAHRATRARLLSDVGQSLVINLTTGETEAGPSLRRAGDGAPVRPAADTAADGRLIGIQLGPETLLTETAPGASTLAATRLAMPRFSPRLGEPIAFQIGNDGRGYVLAVLSDRHRFRQSTLFTLDPATGKLDVSNSQYLRLRFFGRRLTTFASVGQVPEDRTPPTVQVLGSPRMSVTGLLHRLLPVQVRVNEGAFASFRLDLGRRFIGNANGTRDTPGIIRPRDFFIAGKERRDRLRRSVGARARLTISVSDRKGNRQLVRRTVRLTR